MSLKEILIVEDDLATQALVRGIIAKSDYSVHCVNDGEACLKALESWVPDLMVLDIMMPKVSGLEVTKLSVCWSQQASFLSIVSEQSLTAFATSE